MESTMTRFRRPRLDKASFGLLVLAVAATWLFQQDAAAISNKGPFAGLLGSWSGSGQVRYTDGSSQRMTCRGTYTGNSYRMQLALRCFGSGNQVSMNGQMRSTRGKVAGTWQENNFSLSGQVSGTARKGRVRLGISGGVFGNMSVLFTRSTQTVAVRARNVSLQKVTMRMRRSR